MSRYFYHRLNNSKIVSTTAKKFNKADGSPDTKRNRDGFLFPLGEPLLYILIKIKDSQISLGTRMVV